MCGIAGICSKYKREDLISELKNMTDAIRHRGEDDEGYVVYDTHSFYTLGGLNTPTSAWNLEETYAPKYKFTDFSSPALIGFGHRRLSIVDTSVRAHQPMCSQQRDVWITFNGEIYNYKEIQTELRMKGHSFHSDSDTEVLLLGYIEWGEKILEKLNGMWAFVIFDRKKNLVWGSRDRFGVKPLYYYRSEESFAFASEIKSILKFPEVTTSVNSSSAFDYLAFGKSENEAETLFSSIFELLPGYSFTLNISTFTFSSAPYYRLEYNSMWEKFNQNDYLTYTDDIQERILSAVKLRLSEEVPIGITLSGGLDSSSILACTKKIYEENAFTPIGGKLDLFTIKFTDSLQDEFSYAKEMSNFASSFTSHSVVESNCSSIEQDIEKLILLQDIPFFSLSVYAHFQLMALVKKKNIKVIIDGQGGDELFGGYTNHFQSFIFEAIRNGSLDAIQNNFSISSQNSFSFNKNLINYLLKTIIKRYSAEVFEKLYKKTLYRYSLNVDFIEQFKGRLSVMDSSINGLNHSLANDFSGSRLKTLLRISDRNAMNFGIENRSPFSDDISLIQKTFSIPSVYKIRNTTSKSLLRNSMKGLVPDSIRLRKDKVGFATPEYKWFKENESFFLDTLTGKDEYVDYSNVKKNIGRFENELKIDISRLWRILNFNLWRKAYKL